MKLTKRRLLPVFIGFAIAGLLATAIYANLSPGTKAPGFTLPTLDTKTFTLKPGKVVVMDIWATWCPPCRAEVPHLINLQRKLAGTDVIIVGVAVDEQKTTVAEFAKKQGINYTVALDPSGEKLSKGYKLEGIPATYIIDKAGVIRYMYNGFPSTKAEQDKQTAEMEREARALAAK